MCVCECVCLCAGIKVTMHTHTLSRAGEKAFGRAYIHITGNGLIKRRLYTHTHSLCSILIYTCCSSSSSLRLEKIPELHGGGGTLEVCGLKNDVHFNLAIKMSSFWTRPIKMTSNRTLFHYIKSLK